MLTEYFEGNIDLGGRQMKFFGSGNAITTARSNGCQYGQAQVRGDD